jgi:two-component system sensor histidine kinase MtrB
VTGRDIAPRGTRFGLRTRLSMAFALGALVLSASLAVITYELSRTYLLRQRESSLEQQTFVNARLIRNRLRAGEPDIAALLTSLSPQHRSEHALHLPQGWFGGSPAAGPESAPVALRSKLLAGHVQVQVFRAGDEPRLAVGVPLPEVDAAYIAVFRLLELDRTLRTLRNSLIVAALLTAALGALTGRWASRRLLRPLADVSSAAVSIANGDFDVRLDGGPDSDLASVTRSFNLMAAALQERIRRDARFASAVSHELRSPLTTLVASVEVLTARRHELPPRALSAVDLLAAEVRSFQSLVEDLLEISRLDAGVADVALQEVHLGEFMDHALPLSRIGPIDVEYGPGAADAMVAADKRRLERVVANLIDNAEQHGGGVTRVRLERRPGRARIAVEDNGPGVPADERDQIFERFVRGRTGGQRQAAAGVGLGLSLVAEHVRLHGGAVWVEDADGGGARFVVELPARP